MVDKDNDLEKINYTKQRKKGGREHDTLSIFINKKQLICGFLHI